MASLYKKSVKRKDPKTGRTVKAKSKKWWIKFRDEHDILRRKPAFTDKTASQQYAAKLENEARRKKLGLGDDFEEHAQRLLTEHLKEYRAFIIDKGGTEFHAKQVVRRCQAVIKGCGFQYPPQVTASKVQGYLAKLLKSQPEDRKLKQGGRSPQTANHYLRAIKQFLNWMVRERRIDLAEIIQPGDGEVAQIRQDRPQPDADVSLAQQELVPVRPLRVCRIETQRPVVEDRQQLRRAERAGIMAKPRASDLPDRFQADPFRSPAKRFV